MFPRTTLAKLSPDELRAMTELVHAVGQGVTVGGDVPPLGTRVRFHAPDWKRRPRWSVGQEGLFHPASWHSNAYVLIEDGGRQRRIELDVGDTDHLEPLSKAPSDRKLLDPLHAAYVEGDLTPEQVQRYEEIFISTVADRVVTPLLNIARRRAPLTDSGPEAVQTVAENTGLFLQDPRLFSVLADTYLREWSAALAIGDEIGQLFAAWSGLFGEKGLTLAEAVDRFEEILLRAEKILQREGQHEDPLRPLRDYSVT